MKARLRPDGVVASLAGLDFDHLALGVGQARRGWLEAATVLGTRALDALRPLLARTMQG